MASNTTSGVTGAGKGDEPAVRVGDVATITAAALDAQLVGKRFRVVGLAHKTFLTARRLQVQEVTG